MKLLKKKDFLVFLETLAKKMISTHQHQKRSLVGLEKLMTYALITQKLKCPQKAYSFHAKK